MPTRTSDGNGMYDSTLQVSIAKDLCDKLTSLCRDPNVAWPYHPRAGQLGGLLVDTLVRSLMATSDAFGNAIRSGTLLAQRNVSTGGTRRRKRLDLVLSRKDTGAPLLAVETKACMTAHSKAHARLVAELTSSLDAVLDANAEAKLFAIIAINYGDKFTSPLNLPGPNIHEAKDAPTLAQALLNSLSNNREIGASLVLPIRFDNETICEPYPGTIAQSKVDQAVFEKELVSSLGFPLA